jgi:poly-beta-1,6-N-acetyl-D-glucosamine synthase
MTVEDISRTLLQTLHMQVFCLVTFALAAAAIVYVIAGYPALLKWLAGRNGRLPIKEYEPKSVSILIAVYNGEKFIADKLDSVVGLDYPRDLLQIFVLSDGSTDGTNEIAKRYAGRGIQLLELPHGGKPAALNAGLTHCTGEILLLTDVRQVLEPGSLKELVACFADPTIGVVSGDLPTRPGIDSEESNTSLYWRYEREMRKNLGKLGCTFGATGPFYAMRRELARPMPPNTLLDDMYLPLGAFFGGYRLIVDEKARALEYPVSINSEFRRKVRTQAGVYQIMKLYPALLSLNNPLLFHFISYKVGRLALPWLFLLFFLASFGLPMPWSMLAVISQLGFYGLALLDVWMPEEYAVKKITSPARTVTVMLAAAALGIKVFFVPPQTLWTVTQARHRGPA